jgi:hypothetical protein
VALLLALGAAGAQAATPPFEQPRSLAFLQQRGGLNVTEPYRKSNRWYLPVSCNVSGIRKVTRPAEVLHAGLAWSRSTASVEGEAIYLTVYTAQQGSMAPSAECGPARLQRLSGPHYEVYYRDPDGEEHRLRSIDTGL